MRPFCGFRFPAEVPLQAVRWRLSFAASLRGLERMPAGPGVCLLDDQAAVTVLRKRPRHGDGAGKKGNGAMDGTPTDLSAKAAAKTWLGAFEAALASGDAMRIAALFAHECH